MEATYGGTELAEAVAYASQCKTNEKYESKPIPTSVFVLTDGDAWDISGVFANVSNAVNEAKEQNNLFRSFCLGVGDDVSTSMCEGIARVGKGVAVFVGVSTPFLKGRALLTCHTQNNEKPDAKLMNLLRAARGPIIDDLQVDWGVSDIPEQTKDEDFEWVAAGGPAPQPVPPPANISLFDTSNTANTTPELGAKEQTIVLPPPPRIQQAPITEKLPIPLYPGFRCSIFAIIGQSSPSAPFSSSVRIHGQVLGSPVSLEVPVQPVAGEAARISDENVSLLHTLAARVLIQDWEAKEATDITRAEIVRLGTRYSLASTVTSFVAVETGIHFAERKEKMKEAQKVNTYGGVQLLSDVVTLQDVKQTMQQNIDAIVMRGERLDTLEAKTGTLSVSAQQLRRGKSLLSPGSGLGVKKNSGPGNVIQSFFRNLLPQSGSSSAAAKASAFLPVVGSARPSPSPASSFAPQAQTVQPGARSRDSDDEDDAHAPPSYEGSSLPVPVPDAAAPFIPPSFVAQRGAAPPALSVEWIARNQKFDGSFPTTSDFLSLLLRLATLPALPSGLIACSGPKEVKDSVWVTLLTLAVLERKFAGEKDAWQLLAEKSTQFVETALAGGLVTGNVQVGELLAGLRGEAAEHV